MTKYILDGDTDDIAALIDQKIHNARKRRVLKLRFLDGYTYQEIADEIDRTPRQVGNIIRECIPKLVKKIS